MVVIHQFYSQSNSIEGILAKAQEAKLHCIHTLDEIEWHFMGNQFSSRNEAPKHVNYHAGRNEVDREGLCGQMSILLKLTHCKI